ncbi:uncharacterized protein LOC119602669 [Lucilia sericata]|uniref:uncharacterized protein LOC119602669 n=1 Tax=Lucilia sericata TaxID=13632 RepID=UPI0018A86A5B|nr:uncharacterized protein LOC119602669 [Lucilia sericata]
MSCICQYFVHNKERQDQADSYTDTATIPKDCISSENTENNNEPSINTPISASELAAARAENWLLNKNLIDARITIENLESLVKTIMDKQNTMLTEMYHLKRLNQKLEEECRLQRDYHAMERNAMIRELHDVKELLQKRSKLLDETLQKNNELASAVQEVNEKFYLMDIKYIRLKEACSYQSSEQSDTEASSDEEQTE